MKRRSFFKKCAALFAFGIASKVYPHSLTNDLDRKDVVWVNNIKFTPNEIDDVASPTLLAKLPNGVYQGGYMHVDENGSYYFDFRISDRVYRIRHFHNWGNCK